MCWSLALLVGLCGVPGPDAPPGSEYAYSVVVRELLGQQQVRPGAAWCAVQGRECVSPVFCTVLCEGKSEYAYSVVVRELLGQQQVRRKALHKGVECVFAVHGIV